MHALPRPTASVCHCMSGCIWGCTSTFRRVSLHFGLRFGLRFALYFGACCGFVFSRFIVFRCVSLCIRVFHCMSLRFAAFPFEFRCVGGVGERWDPGRVRMKNQLIHSSRTQKTSRRIKTHSKSVKRIKAPSKLTKNTHERTPYAPQMDLHAPKRTQTHPHAFQTQQDYSKRI